MSSAMETTISQAPRAVSDLLKTPIEDLTKRPPRELSDVELLAVKEYAKEQARLKPQGAPVSIPCKVSRIHEIFQYQDPEALIDGLLFRNTLTILSGFTGTGKTLLAHEIEKSVLDGFPVFGNPSFKVRQTGSVLLFDSETPASFLKQRLQGMGFEETAPFYVAHFSSLRIDADRDFEIIKAIIGEVRPALVVFDSLLRFHCADENDAAEMSRVMERFRELANITTIMLIHHMTKSMADIRVRSRGSGDIIGSCDLELALTPDESGALVCQSVKTRTRPIEPFRLRIVEEGGRLAVKYQGIKEAPQVKLSRTVREILATPMGEQEIISSLASRGIDASRSSVKRTLSEIGEELQIMVGQRGRKTYHLPTCPGVQDLSKAVNT